MNHNLMWEAPWQKPALNYGYSSINYGYVKIISTKGSSLHLQAQSAAFLENSTDGSFTFAYQ